MVLVHFEAVIIGEGSELDYVKEFANRHILFEIGQKAGFIVDVLESYSNGKDLVFEAYASFDIESKFESDDWCHDLREKVLSAYDNTRFNTNIITLEEE